MASYPWSTYSAQTQQRQQEINFLAVKIGRCPPVIEDGKLGPSTCGAAKIYAQASPSLADMLGSCKSYNDAAAIACMKLPLGVKNTNTLSLQIALNNILVPQGFCKITEDGILGSTTCAAAKQVLGETVAKNLGCSSYGALKTCSATSTPGAPLAPVPSVTPATTPAVTAETPKPVMTSTPSAETTVTVPTGPTKEQQAAWAKKCTDAKGTVDGSQCVWTENNWCDLQSFGEGRCFPLDVDAEAAARNKKSSSMWPWLIGAGVLAVGAGTYVAMKKKKK